jgi:hypothetical protein
MLNIPATVFMLDVIQIKFSLDQSNVRFTLWISGRSCPARPRILIQTYCPPCRLFLIKIAALAVLYMVTTEIMRRNVEDSAIVFRNKDEVEMAMMLFASKARPR